MELKLEQQFKKGALEMVLLSLIAGSEMCIRDSLRL